MSSGAMAAAAASVGRLSTAMRRPFASASASAAAAAGASRPAPSTGARRHSGGVDGRGFGRGGSGVGFRTRADVVRSLGTVARASSPGERDDDDDDVPRATAGSDDGRREGADAATTASVSMTESTTTTPPPASAVPNRKKKARRKVKEKVKERRRRSAVGKSTVAYVRRWSFTDGGNSDNEEGGDSPGAIAGSASPTGGGGGGGGGGIGGGAIAMWMGSVGGSGGGDLRAVQQRRSFATGGRGEEETIEIIDLEATLRNNPNMLDGLGSRGDGDGDDGADVVDFDAISGENDAGDGGGLEVSDVGMEELIHELEAAGDVESAAELRREFGSHLGRERSIKSVGEGGDAPKEKKKDGDNLGFNWVSDEELERVMKEVEKNFSTQGSDGDDDDDESDDAEDVVEEEIYVSTDDIDKHTDSGSDTDSHSNSDADSNNNSGDGDSDSEEWTKASPYQTPDWTDYDSRSAFAPDFAEDDSWIPPSELRARYTAYDADSDVADPSRPLDWLTARRARLGDATNTSEGGPAIPAPAVRAVDMLPPDSARRASRRFDSARIPVLENTLLSPDEVVRSLEARGGKRAVVISTELHRERYGAGIGCDNIVVITARDAGHVRSLAESIHRDLRARGLHDRGVVGAALGPEGGRDVLTSKRNRHKRSARGGMGIAPASGKVDDGWMVVDCANIHVHVLDAPTRQALNIEGLWDLSNPNSEGSKLRALNWRDDDAVDDYVASHPVPEAYAASVRGDGSGGSGGGVDVMPVFERKSFSSKWTPGGEGFGTKKKKKKTRKGKRRARGV